jgi:hypothetical protein
MSINAGTLGYLTVKRIQKNRYIVTKIGSMKNLLNTSFFVLALCGSLLAQPGHMPLPDPGSPFPPSVQIARMPLPDPASPYPPAVSGTEVQLVKAAAG